MNSQTPYGIAFCNSEEDLMYKLTDSFVSIADYKNAYPLMN